HPRLAVCGVVKAAPPAGHSLILWQLPAADRRVEFARDAENAVADDLGLQALRREAPEQLIVGVDRPTRMGGRGLRLQAIGIAGDDQAIEMLDAPAAVHEFHGEPIY